MGNHGCCAVPKDNVPQKKNKNLPLAYLEKQKPVKRTSKPNVCSQQEGYNSCDDTYDDAKQNKIVYRTKSSPAKKVQKSQQERTSHKTQPILTEKHTKLKHRDIDFLNFNSCQNVLSDVIEASNEDQSSVWFSKIGKRSLSRESDGFTTDVYRCSAVLKLQESIDNRDVSQSSKDSPCKLKDDDLSSASSPWPTSKSASSAPNRLTPTSFKRDVTSHQEEEPTLEFEESEEIDFYTPLPIKHYQPIHDCAKEEDSDFEMKRVGHDYFEKHGDDSAADNSESGLSFLAKVSPEKTEIYSESILLRHGLEEESSSFIRVEDENISKAQDSSELIQYGGNKRISTADSSNILEEDLIDNNAAYKVILTN